MKILLILFFSINGLYAQLITENKFIESNQHRIITSEAIVTRNRFDTVNNIVMRLPIHVVMSTSYIKNTTIEGSILLTLAVSGSKTCIEKGEIWLALEDNTMIILNQKEFNRGEFVYARAYLGELFETQMTRLKTLAKTNVKRIELNTCNNFIAFDIKEDMKEVIRKHFELLLESMKEIRD